MGAAGSGPTFRSVCWPSCSVGFRLCSIALLSSFLALRDHGVSADELEEVVAEELERPSPGQLVGGEPSLSRVAPRSEDHTSKLQSRENIVCCLLLEKNNNK